jgi:carbonic anhydrase
LWPVCAAFGATEWNYGDHGPDKWGALDPEYATCRDGKQQSPIDLRDGLQEQLPPLKLAWKNAVKFTVVNNGHTIQLSAEPGSSIELDGVKSEFVQLHFHSPSEHAISGKRAAMEAHFVHRGHDGRLTVLAVLLDPGAGNPVLAAAMKAAPAKPEASGSTITIDPRGLLPASVDRSWRYTGSLTTPPCTEGVEWIVLAQTIPVTSADIERFRAIIPSDARPLQPRGARKVDRP